MERLPEEKQSLALVDGHRTVRLPGPQLRPWGSQEPALSADGTYKLNCPLPKRTGPHIIYNT